MDSSSPEAMARIVEGLITGVGSWAEVPSSNIKATCVARLQRATELPLGLAATTLPSQSPYSRW
jgi:hypothetical protein